MFELLAFLAVPLAAFAVAGLVVAVRTFIVGLRLLRAGRDRRAAAVLVGGLLSAASLAGTPWLVLAMVLYVENLPSGCGGPWSEHPVHTAVVTCAVAMMVGVSRGASTTFLQVAE